jgi:hypothetical protein
MEPKFLLYTDFSGILNFKTFSAVPSIINGKVKKRAVPLKTKPYLSLLGRELVLFEVVEGVSLVVVVEHPLAEVVGDVEGSVVVAAELVVDDHNRVVLGPML